MWDDTPGMVKHKKANSITFSKYFYKGCTTVLLTDH